MLGNSCLCVSPWDFSNFLFGRSIAGGVRWELTCLFFLFFWKWKRLKSTFINSPHFQLALVSLRFGSPYSHSSSFHSPIFWGEALLSGWVRMTRYWASDSSLHWPSVSTLFSFSLYSASKLPGLLFCNPFCQLFLAADFLHPAIDKSTAFPTLAFRLPKWTEILSFTLVCPCGFIVFFFF